MKKKSADLNLKMLGPLGRNLLHPVLRYAGIMFFVLVAAVYGFVILRISTLSGTQPSDSDISAVTTQTKSSAVPNIDPKVVQQLQTLKDNSTNVQTLFDQARANPFRE